MMASALNSWLMEGRATLSEEAMKVIAKTETEEVTRTMVLLIVLVDGAVAEEFSFSKITSC
jgi:hypothetical protein